MLRGTVEAFRAIAAVARWEAARARRLRDGPRRPGWPDLAADRTPLGPRGRGRAGVRRPSRRPRGAALSERESLALLAAAGVPVTQAAARDRRRLPPRPPPRSSGSRSSLKLDAAGLAHKTRRRRRAARPAGRGDGPSRGRGPAGDRRAPAARWRGRPRARRRADGAAGPRAHRRARPRPARSGRSSSSGSAGSWPRRSTTSSSGSRRSTATRRWRCSTSCAAPGCSTASEVAPAVDRAAVAEVVVAVGRLGVRAPGHRSRSTSTRSSPARRDRRGRRPRRPRRTVIGEPLVLRDPTPWGVRLDLNRPDKLNALNAELRDELTAAIAEAAADERVRVIAIAGAGRAFCSGYDLSEEQPATALGWRDVLARDVAATLAVWPLPEAGHRPGPRLRDRRRARAGDGLRPDRRRRGRPARRARDPVRVGAGDAAHAVRHRPEEDPRAAADRRPDRRPRGGADRPRQPRRPGRPPRGRGRRPRRPPRPRRSPTSWPRRSRC